MEQPFRKCSAIKEDIVEWYYAWFFCARNRLQMRVIVQFGIIHQALCLNLLRALFQCGNRSAQEILALLQNEQRISTEEPWKLFGWLSDSWSVP